MSETAYDVVVVGAGVTGLLTAVRLHQAGRRVLVLEARDRVGGRLWTAELEGHRLELGGQWISPDQTALIALVQELGLETFARHREGDGVYLGADGVRLTYTDELPLPAASAAEFDRLAAVLQELSLAMDPDRPWELDSAAELDRIGFADWLATLSDDAEARDNIALCIGPAMLTKPSYAFSALQAIHFGASAGGFLHLTDPDFILDQRVTTGFQSIPLTLAGLLPEGAVQLGEPATAVAWGGADVDAGVTVSTGRASYTAARVVLAVPPTLVDRISFSPPLPALQLQLRQHQSFGLVIKLHITYDRPFWREKGLSGTAFSPYRLVHEAYDNTNHDAEGREGTLVGFVSDVHADRLLALSAEEREAQVLAVLAEYYGEEALAPVHYYESPWVHEEWTAGAYGSSFDLGGTVRYGAALREPVGPITVISSDVAGLGFQHVDGGVRVAEETAARLLTEL
jgi:putrescine oxidase